MLTAFLSKSDVTRHTRALHLLRELREGLAQQPESLLVTENPLLRHGSIPGHPAYSISSRNRSHSVVQLFDWASAQLLAVMEGEHLRSMRTSIVGAIGVDVLARDTAKHVAILGSGAAASGALKALRLVRSLERVWMYEPALAANTELTLKLASSMNTSVRGTDSAEEAVAGADIIVLTGDVSLPLDAVRPGAHITILNAETFTASPLPAEITARANWFCDVAPSWISRGTSCLRDVLSGAAAGRTTPEDVTVFASTGPAYLDLLTAWHVYEGAKYDEGLTRFDLEA